MIFVLVNCLPLPLFSAEDTGKLGLLDFILSCCKYIFIKGEEEKCYGWGIEMVFREVLVLHFCNF